MPTYEVYLSDGRTTKVKAPDEDGAKQQAEHWDRDRFVIAIKRNHPPGPSPCKAVATTKVKD